MLYVALYLLVGFTIGSLLAKYGSDGTEEDANAAFIVGLLLFPLVLLVALLQGTCKLYFAYIQFLIRK